MKLQEELLTYSQKARENIPPEAWDIMTRSTRELAESGIAAKALQKGAQAPEFSLPDIYGTMVNSREVLNQGPLVVIFFRGTW